MKKKNNSEGRAKPDWVALSILFNHYGVWGRRYWMLDTRLLFILFFRFNVFLQ